MPWASGGSQISNHIMCNIVSNRNNQTGAINETNGDKILGDKCSLHYKREPDRVLNLP